MNRKYQMMFLSVSKTLEHPKLLSGLIIRANIGDPISSSNYRQHPKIP